MEKRYCSFCGDEVNQDSKFCKNCGQSLNQVQTTSEVLDNSEKKNFIDKGSVDAAKETAHKTAEKVKQTVADSQVTNKIQTTLQELNKKPEKKAKVKRIVSLVLAVLLMGFGWSWFANKDYRKAMANGDSYFTQGKYEKAVEFYQKAHDEKPNDKKATKMGDYAEELSAYWTSINEDDFSYPRTEATVVEEIEKKLPEIKDKEVKKKYTEAVEVLKKTNGYQIQKRVEKKYKDAYDIKDDE